MISTFIFNFLVSFSISISAFGQIAPQVISQETAARLERVPEFKFIKEEANKLGVKVYLFGGTASAFAHYVRWDLEREAGDEKYQAERFDYDFTNIYRGNQDLDIVVDGTAEQAAALQQILKEKYPHFVGSKDAWEVRLLRAEIGDKLPLLDNPDFLNQHTDTNSTGMVAVNADENEIVFRDLFAWENPDSVFLNDVAAGRIKFLFSDNHETTTRFKNGQNPPVFAAIRYLAKLAQYEVDEAEGDLEIIKRIVEGANWNTIKNNEYVKYKLEEFGKKALLNAPDSEYAWNLLEDVGLRKRLIEMDGSRINTENSLSWWMNKEPLRTKPLGEGSWRTAAEIFKNHMNESGEIVVAHETRSFEAYENITRSSHGAANAFISRKGVSGEGALHGDGFYTKLGTKGAAGTNLTIRFKLNPKAKEGADFTYNSIGYIVVKNKKSLELIQEDLNISIVDFFKLTISNSISESDKGLKEKLFRKFNRKSVSDMDFQESKDFVKDFFFIASDFPSNLQFDFSKVDEIDNFSDLYEFFIANTRSYYVYLITRIDNSKIELKVEWLESLIAKGTVDEWVARVIYSDKYWSKHPELVQALIDKNHTQMEFEIVKELLSQEHWAGHSELVQALIDKGDAQMDFHIAIYVLSKEYWAGHPELVQSLIEKGNADALIAEYVLSKEYWAGHPELVQSLIVKGNADALITKYILSKEYWSDYPELVLTFIDVDGDKTALKDLFLQEHWARHPVLLEYLNYQFEDKITKVTLDDLNEKKNQVSFDEWRSLTIHEFFLCKEVLK